MAERLAALRARLAARRAELRQAVRVTVGTAAAFALYQAFALPQGYWAVFTVIIVMQGSLGGTLGASADRMVGTLLGAVVGGVAAALRPHGPAGLGVALVASVAVTSMAAAVKPRFKVAPVTAAIMLLSSSGGLSPEKAAVLRVAEIALGGLVGVLAAAFVLPARSRALVAERAAAVLDRLAALFRHHAEALDAGRGFDPHPDHAALRAALGAVEAALADAELERSSRLGDHRVPPAVPRTLWRVRNDLVSVGRAADRALPAPVTYVLGPAAATLLRAEAVLASRCAAALLAGGVVARGDIAARHDAFEAAFGELREAGLTRGLDFDEAGRVFGLAFALESLHRNLAELAERVDEMGAGAPERTASRLLRRERSPPK